MNQQVKTIQFSARVVGGFADCLATVTMVDGTVKHFSDQAATAALVTFAFGYGIPQLDDARDVVRAVPQMTGKPLPEWVTP
jgi:hypothetical protein